MKDAGARRWWLAAMAVAALMGWLEPRLDIYLADVLARVAINVVLAVSLNLINGHAGQFSLGHAGFMGVGAYAAAALTVLAAPKVLPGGGDGWLQQAWFLVALLGGGAAAALAGLLVGAPSLRLKGDYLAIVTLGFGQIIGVIVRNMEPLGGALGMSGLPARTNLFWVLAAAATTIYGVTALVNSTHGRGFIATHDDEVAAEAMGLDTTRYKIVAFVTGAFFAGIAGGLWGHFKLTISPKEFDFNRSIEIVVMVIVGGMGRTAGVIAAAAVLTLMPEGLRLVAGLSPSLKWVGESRPLLYAILLIALMLLRPQGLFAWGRNKTRAA
ncbi:MAG: branched-chain amino acid ABC transporter permease [Verrucomicrobiota bacterium]